MVPRGCRISTSKEGGSRLCPALKSWLINPRGKIAHSYRGKNSPAIRFSQRNQLNSTLTARLEVMSRWYTIGSFNRNSIGWLTSGSTHAWILLGFWRMCCETWDPRCYLSVILYSASFQWIHSGFLYCKGGVKLCARKSSISDVYWKVFQKSMTSKIIYFGNI